MWWQEIVSGFVFMAYLFNTFHGYLFNTYPELKYIKTIVLNAIAGNCISFLTVMENSKNTSGRNNKFKSFLNSIFLK